MKLEFIQHSGPDLDATSKARIRRHAAKGKNVGRKITRPSRVKALQPRRQPDEDESSSASPEDDAKLQICLGVGDTLTFLDLPVTVAPTEREIIFNAISFIAGSRYAPGLERALSPSTSTGSVWVRGLLTDAASFHTAIATYLESTQSTLQSRDAAIRHTVEAFRLINIRLSSADKVSFSTMATVLSLSGNDMTQGRYQQGYVHASGLLRMVDVRGGPAVLAKEQPVLFQKLYRSDLDYAIRLGTPLRTDIRVFEAFNPMTTLDLTDTQSSHTVLGPQLGELWGNACALSRIVNDVTADRRERLGHADFVRAYVWLGHRLIGYLPLRSSAQLPRLRRITYLGLVAFVSSFMCGLDRRIRENPTLAQLVRDELHGLADLAEDAREPLLWLLLLCGIPLQESGHKSWLVSSVAEVMSACGLYNWTQLKRVLERYPWVDSFYDDSASTLCSHAVPGYLPT